MQMKPEITQALNENKTKLYPYIFIDKTNQARVNCLQVYVEIFGKHKEVIIGNMKYYLMSETDFKANFKVLSKNTAKSKKDKRGKRLVDRKPKRRRESSSSESESSQTSSGSDTQSDSSSESD